MAASVSRPGFSLVAEAEVGLHAYAPAPSSVVALLDPPSTRATTLKRAQRRQRRGARAALA